MSRKINTSPIIIAGMHRAGTSMLTRILDDVGLEFGVMKDSNYESLFFQRINIWMMSLISSSWDSPKEFENIDPKLLNHIKSQLYELLDSRSNALYFGWKSLILKKSFLNMQSPWGWKDPRNTFTLDIWSKIFPDARIVYLIRHPIDIAYSLIKRQQKEIDHDINSKNSISSIIKTLLKINHTNYNSSMLVNSYADCIELIDLYYNQIIKQKSDNVLIVKFEDILLNPSDSIKGILQFCNLSTNNISLEWVSSNIIKSKALSYKKDVELIKLEQEFGDLIYKMGYDKAHE